MIAIIAAVVVYVISLLVTKTILESDILMLPKEKIAKLLNKIKVLVSEIMAQLKCTASRWRNS